MVRRQQDYWLFVAFVVAVVAAVAVLVAFIDRLSDTRFCILTGFLGFAAGMLAMRFGPDIWDRTIRRIRGW